MKALKLIYYVFIVFIGIIAVLLIVSIFPIVGNYKIMVVQSGSMEPTINTGGIVLVKPVDDYKIGDVITFEETSGAKIPITHRIYDVEQSGNVFSYITKGDANDGPDSKIITSEQIIGKVLIAVPYMGYAIESVRKPFGFLLILVIPALIIIFDELKKIFKEIKKIKSKKTINGKV